MSSLLIQIPERRRLRAGAAADSPAASGLATEYAWALSPDGLLLESQGQAAASLLPKATTVIAVLADADVSWHRITLPKAPASRLRAALVGVLEDALLEDVEAVHLAVAPGATAGQPAWIAVVDRAWLRAELAALEKADVFVDRVVPSSWPDDPPSGHFAETGRDDSIGSQGVVLHWAHPDGVASIRLQGGLSRSLIPRPAPQGTRWSATPGAAAAAEQWLGMPVNVMSPAERMLQAGRTLWNLRQFDLVQRNRGARALRDAWRHFNSPAWRPVRIGLVTFVVAQLVGLNLWAWHQRDAVASKRAALQAVVKATFPRVSALDLQRDPVAVMNREVQALRTLAGRPGDNDLEPLLQAAAAAWPTERPPVDNVRYEQGRLTLSAAGWAEPQIAAFRDQLEPAGWRVEASEGRLVLSRMRPGARS